MDAIPLRSVRPLIFKTICVTDLNKERVDLMDDENNAADDDDWLATPRGAAPRGTPRGGR